MLDQAKPVIPYWYSVEQRIALGQSWNKERYDALSTACSAKFPSYDPFVFSEVYWLQPRWYGQPGEAEKFLAAASDTRGGEEGDILYARAAWYLDSYALKNPMKYSEFKWPRIKSGMEALIKRYPDNNVVRAAYCVLAVEAGDKEAAATAF